MYTSSLVLSLVYCIHVMNHLLRIIFVTMNLKSKEPFEEEFGSNSYTLNPIYSTNLYNLVLVLK